MRTMLLRILMFVLSGAVPALAQLPPEILVDSYLLRAEQAIGEGDPVRARAEINKINLLEKEHELDLPNEFYFRYAQIAAATDLPKQAHEAVVKYLTVAGREGRHYSEALELMNQVRDAIETSKEPQEVSNEPSPPSQEASHAPATDPSGAGGTPGRQRARVGSVVTRPHLFAERKFADCKQWGKWNYFGAATIADVSACLDADVDPITPNELLLTSLHMAAASTKDPEIIQALVAAGASLEARDGSGHTPLHRAVKYNKNPAVVQALLAAGASLEARDRAGHTPLSLAAASTKDPEIIQALVAAGSSLEVRGGNSTPLHWAAAFNENPAVVQALLAAGASLEAQDVDKETPLHWAAQHNGNPAVVQALLAAGANPNARNEKGKRPVDLTKRKENRRMLAAARRTSTQKSSGGGGGLGTLIAAATVAGAGAVSGASTEAILAGVEAVAAGQQASTGGSLTTAIQNPVETAASNAGGGSCEIPGYPSPPGGVAGVGLRLVSGERRFPGAGVRAAGRRDPVLTCSGAGPPTGGGESGEEPDQRGVQSAGVFVREIRVQLPLPDGVWRV